MAKSFTGPQWEKILKRAQQSGEEFGLPVRRRKSVVLGTFNIRKLGKIANKSGGAWAFLRFICERFDLLNVQEVQDNLDGINRLKSSLGPKYGMVVSDTTGNFPGDGTSPERLAVLFHWPVVERTEVASDITYDRSHIARGLFQARKEYAAAFKVHKKELDDWEIKKAARKKAGKRSPTKPPLRLPQFLTFIRQPHCASFEIKGSGSAEPYRFLVVNVHLLFGKYPEERRMEFYALLEWLIARAANPKRMYHPNILMMGDCNLEFKNADAERAEIESDLKRINTARLRHRKAAKLNMPLLSVHPNQTEVFRTAARLKDTYDQIAIFAQDKRLPTPEANKTAGASADGFDYGVFNFVELFAQTLHGQSFTDLKKGEKKKLIGRFEHDLTDHLPTWIRLPVPASV